MSGINTAFRQITLIGCGDIGCRIAGLWRQRSDLPIRGMVKSDASAARIQALGIVAHQCDLDNNIHINQEVIEESLIYYLIPPGAQGAQDQRLRQLLANLPGLPARVIAISTSGVYGDQQGALVTEDIPPRPQVDRARRRLDMEQQWQTWCKANKVPLIILRVGGIYGPGRLPLQRIRDQIPMLEEHLAPQTNRIHADDLAAVCVAAADVNFDYRIYNVCDGQDGNMTEYFDTIAEYFGLPLPPKIDWPTAEAQLSAGMLSYLRESRRLDISRLKTELNIEFKYPDLRSGLAHCDKEKEFAK